jgi:hypothetical protein
MLKIVVLTFSVLSFSPIVCGQFSDFPVGFASVPESKLNGPVRTVLFVEKRGNSIVESRVSTYNQKAQILETLSSGSYSVGRNPDQASVPQTEEQVIQQSEKQIYIYDQGGRLVRENRFIDDQYFDYELYGVDDKRRRVSSKRFSSDGSPEELFLMKYLDNSREVRVTWQAYKSGELERPNGAVLRYDKSGRWTSRMMDIDDEPVRFEYDSHGNLVKEVDCCKYNYWYVYANKLDKYGNWIEREITFFYKTKDGTEERRPETTKQFRVISYFGDTIKNSSPLMQKRSRQ